MALLLISKEVLAASLNHMLILSTTISGKGGKEESSAGQARRPSGVRSQTGPCRASPWRPVHTGLHALPQYDSSASDLSEELCA